MANRPIWEGVALIPPQSLAGIERVLNRVEKAANAQLKIVAAMRKVLAPEKMKPTRSAGTRSDLDIGHEAARIERQLAQARRKRALPAKAPKGSTRD